MEYPYHVIDYIHMLHLLVLLGRHHYHRNNEEVVCAVNTY
jgi:hypothetical protein